MQRIHSSDLHPPHRRHRSYSVGVAWLVVRYLPQVGGIRMGAHRLRTRPTPRAGYDQEAVVPKRTALGPEPAMQRGFPLGCSGPHTGASPRVRPMPLSPETWVSPNAPSTCGATALPSTA